MNIVQMNTGNCWPDSNAVMRVSGYLMLLYLLYGSPAKTMESSETESDLFPKKSVTLLVMPSSELQEIGKALVDVLALRLSRYSVTAQLYESKNDTRFAQSGPDWTVILQSVSETAVIVAVDNTGDIHGIQEVRTVRRDPKIDEIAWTLGLVVEEIVSPYLDGQQEIAALGAGLAIIEPEVIGGTRKLSSNEHPSFPRLKGIGLLLSLSGIWSIQEIIVGPHMILKGSFTERMQASLEIGWAGNAAFQAEGISGTMSRVPLTLLFGYALVQHPHFDVVGWSGVSLGFALYKTHMGEFSRTDISFQPGLDVHAEMIVLLGRSWAISFRGGCTFPLVRDVLVNRGTAVYSQIWVVPSFLLGTQLYF